MFARILTVLFQPEALSLLPLLRRQLLSPGQARHDDELRNAITNLVRSGSAPLHRVDERDIRRKVDSILGPQSGINYSPLRLLNKLGSVFLTERNGLPAFKFWQDVETIPSGSWEGMGEPIDKLELWRDISLRMDTTPVLSAFLVANDIPITHPAYHPWRDLLINDRDVLGVLERGIGETHVHLSSLFSFAGMVDVFLNPSSFFYHEVIRRLDERDRQNPTFFRSVPNVPALAALLAIRYELLCRIRSSDYWIQDKDLDCRLDLVNSMDPVADVARMDRGIIKSYFNWAAQWCCHAGNEDLEVLLNEKAFLGRVMEVLQGKNGDGALTRDLLLFIIYLQLKNVIFNRLTMSRDAVGFQAFRRQFLDMRSLAPSYRHAIRTLITGHKFLVLEVRICPDDRDYSSVKKYLVDLLDVYRRLIAGEDPRSCPARSHCPLVSTGNARDGNSNAECPQLVAPVRSCSRQTEREGDVGIQWTRRPPRLGIIAHFTKPDEDIFDTALRSFGVQARGAGNSGADYPARLDVLKSRCSVYLSSAMIIDMLCERCPDLSSYLVGIDVANVETAIPNYVFYPPISLLRDSWRYGGRRSNRQNLGLTFHIGEDFFDLLTSLRNVDWLLEAFRFLPGDRIGHGLSLGIDPDWWYSRHSPVTITLEDEVLNGIWQYALEQEHVIDPDDAATREQTLLALAHRWFGMPEIDIHDLLLFYKLRHEAFFLYLLKDDTINRRFSRLGSSVTREIRRIRRRVGDDDLCRALAGEDAAGGFSVLAKMFELYFRDGANLKRGLELRHIPYNRSLRKRITDIQAYVAGQVERRGVIVEANISSNFIIMGLDRICDHPIFRWRNCRDGQKRLSVSLNTDNPAIFNTSLEVEYGLLFHGALSQGMSREEALDLLEEVRKVGLRSSFVVTSPERDLAAELVGLCRLIDDLERRAAE